MRVWWSSIVVALAFFGTDGLGVSTANAGYISCEMSEASLTTLVCRDAARDAHRENAAELVHQIVSTSLPPVPMSGGTGSSPSVAVDFAVCLCPGPVDETRPSARSKLLVDRSEAPPGNPILDGILRPPRV